MGVSLQRAKGHHERTPILDALGSMRCSSWDSSTTLFHTPKTVKGLLHLVPPRTPRSSGYGVLCTCVYVTCYFCYIFSLGPSSGTLVVFGYIEVHANYTCHKLSSSRFNISPKNKNSKIILFMKSWHLIPGRVNHIVDDDNRHLVPGRTSHISTQMTVVTVTPRTHSTSLCTSPCLLFPHRSLFFYRLSNRRFPKQKKIFFFEKI